MHCSPSYCVRYRCGSSATSSSAARLKRRGQQERQARERRERARKKLAAAALQARACRVQFAETPLLQRENPSIFQAKKQKFLRGAPPRTPLGLCPRPRCDRSCPSAVTPGAHPEFILRYDEYIYGTPIYGQFCSHTVMPEPSHVRRSRPASCGTTTNQNHCHDPTSQL